MGQLDYLIVGAGLYGATFARLMTDAGWRCAVVERRDYIGGNCADQMVEGIPVCRHGGHIFHTNNRDVFGFMTRFADFWPYRHRVAVNYRGDMYSFPINLQTLYQLFGTKTPAEARAEVDGWRLPDLGHDDLESYALATVGEEIYEVFIQGYTQKQWGRNCCELPSSILKRLPIRYTWNDDYFGDTYQGIPAEGYTALFERMLEDIPVYRGVEWSRDMGWDAKRIVYTGPIDALFDYDEGVLEYRSLRWEQERFDKCDYQGIATVNYTAAEIPYTRIIEWKHFMERPPRNTVISREYPEMWRKGLERYYPVGNANNRALARIYQQRALKEGYILGGRLASYRYMDMHQVVAQAMRQVERLQ